LHKDQCGELAGATQLALDPSLSAAQEARRQTLFAAAASEDVDQLEKLVKPRSIIRGARGGERVYTWVDLLEAQPSAAQEIAQSLCEGPKKEKEGNVSFPGWFGERWSDLDPLQRSQVEIRAATDSGLVEMIKEEGREQYLMGMMQSRYPFARIYIEIDGDLGSLLYASDPEEPELDAQIAVSRLVEPPKIDRFIQGVKIGSEVAAATFSEDQLVEWGLQVCEFRNNFIRYDNPTPTVRLATILHGQTGDADHTEVAEAVARASYNTLCSWHDPLRRYRFGFEDL